MASHDPDQQRLARALSEAWDPSTSNDPARWSSENRALGQCAVTALVVQDFRGGELLRTTVHGVSHYWNRLASGEEVDLTRQQFDDFVAEGLETRTRDYLLANDDTRSRYLRLRGCVTDQLERA